MKLGSGTLVLVCLMLLVADSALVFSQFVEVRRQGFYRVIPTHELLYPSDDAYNAVETYKVKLKQMFYKGLGNYMKHAFPRDQLAPLSCKGVDTWGQHQLSLVDSLDSLLFFGDVPGFAQAVQVVLDCVKFENSSHPLNVFEANIRLLGGLLSSHILAEEVLGNSYAGGLLDLATKLGDRLILAFDSPTGLPYSKLRLRQGPVRGHKGYNLVCTAAAATFLLEFGWLSRLTGKSRYENASREALRQVWQMRSNFDLISETINVDIGEWEGESTTLGANIDSFFEYTLKSYVAFSSEKESGDIFIKSYHAAMSHLVYNNIPLQANFLTGELEAPLAIHSLAAFFPGVQVLSGDLVAAKEMLSNYLEILNDVVFLPEVTLLDHRFGFQPQSTYYIQRPELMESIWYMYLVTKDWRLVQWAMSLVDRIQLVLQTKCGFACLESVESLRRSDTMESFFLSETLKYLYLILDHGNQFNSVNYVFNTEAHPFPATNKKCKGDGSSKGWKKHKTRKQCIDEMAEVRRRNAGKPFPLAGFSSRLCPPKNELMYPAPKYRLPDCRSHSLRGTFCNDAIYRDFVVKRQCRNPQGLELFALSITDIPNPRFLLKVRRKDAFSRE